MELMYAEDPIAAVAYTFRAINSENPEEPTWAAQRMFETIARYIRATMQFPLKGPELVSEIVKQPLMQAEFSRQFQDLDELINWTPEVGLLVKKGPKRIQLYRTTYPYFENSNVHSRRCELVAYLKLAGITLPLESLTVPVVPSGMPLPPTIFSRSLIQGSRRHALNELSGTWCLLQ